MAWVTRARDSIFAKTRFARNKHECAHSINNGGAAVIESEYTTISCYKWKGSKLAGERNMDKDRGFSGMIYTSRRLDYYGEIPPEVCLPIIVPGHPGERKQ
ncbi:hypothetical protein PV327_000033 [Microctonus hyperodae]|uniref:Uncharacterized protein n=1 Tax=Microctonus hyperodae TaxID=165561 RepID=A0AA39G6B8_MICHY|nr:hypothetical protein PV327_000033 [Microctonus hyperodae]